MRFEGTEGFTAGDGRVVACWCFRLGLSWLGGVLVSDDDHLVDDGHVVDEGLVDEVL